MSDITEWNVESEDFWERSGKQIALRNLWISVISLICGFAVWLCWSVITIQMLNLGFPFSASELFNLIAIAGLSGATLQIPSSFFIRLAGGRNTICFTTALLIIPSVGIGLALLSKETPFWVFQLLAALSGLGGGNFASSMSNIRTFFPKKEQGFALGFNAGLGVFGVTMMQILLPLIMLAALFGGEPMLLENESGIFIDKVTLGTPVYIHNAGYVWLLFLVPLVATTWFCMNNIRTSAVSPEIANPLNAFFIITVMLAMGLTATCLGVWLLSLETDNNTWLHLPNELVLLIVLGVTMALLRSMPDRFRRHMNSDYQIFANKHTWAMSVLHTMTFGSFIGFSAVFALCINVVFGYSHVIGTDGLLTHDTVNVYGPSALMYAWMGPLVGVLTRPVGSWLAEKVGGALVTQCVALLMVISILIAAYYLKLAYHSPSPEKFFAPFFLSFLVLFSASGIGNGSSLHTMSVVFNKEQVGIAIGWASAIAAFGAFYIPQVLAEQIKLATPENALYGFALFYSICMLINGWFYLRRNEEFYQR